MTACRVEGLLVASVYAADVSVIMCWSLVTSRSDTVASTASVMTTAASTMTSSSVEVCGLRLFYLLHC